jgi:hypothetical protein
LDSELSTNCLKNSSFLETMIEDGLLSAANLSAALLGMDDAMDDIPFFSPAGVHAWRAYHCSKRQTLVSLVSDEDLARISAALLGDNSAMDDVPCFSTAGAQAWRAYDYLNDHHAIIGSL